MNVSIAASAHAVTPHVDLAPTLLGEHSQRASWYTLLFITIVFYLVDHHFAISVDTSLGEMSMAAEKASAVAAGNMRRQLGYFVFGIYGLLAWLRLPRFRLQVRGLVAVMVLIFLGWAVLSLAWSVSPALTLRRLIALVLMALGIAGLLRQLSGPDILRLILFMTLSYLVVGIAAELSLGAFTPWSSGYRFAGTLHPNLQGINCAALVFSALTLSGTSRYRPVLVAIAVGGLGFLVLTGSRGALFGSVAGLSALWFLRARRNLAVMVAAFTSCLALLGGFLVVNGLLSSPVKLLLMERTEGVGVLTGRPDLWAILLEYARARPLLGYGYGAFFDPERGLDLAARVGTWAFGGPHSVYLGALVDLGAIGLVCLVVILVGAALTSVRAYRRVLEPHFVFFTALLVFQIVNGFTEAQLLTPNPCFIPGLAVAFLAFDPVSSRPDTGERRPQVRAA